MQTLVQIHHAKLYIKKSHSSYQIACELKVFSGTTRESDTLFEQILKIEQDTNVFGILNQHLFNETKGLYFHNTSNVCSKLHLLTLFTEVIGFRGDANVYCTTFSFTVNSIIHIYRGWKVSLK